jgi:hypothetical protein
VKSFLETKLPKNKKFLTNLHFFSSLFSVVVPPFLFPPGWGFITFMEQALPLLLPGGEWCSPCCFAVHLKDGAAVLVAALVPAALTWIAVLGAWSCCRWRGRRCPAGAVNEVLQELSKPMLSLP